MWLIAKLACVLLLMTWSSAASSTKKVVQVELARVSNSEFRVLYKFPDQISDFEFAQSANELSEKGLELITPGLEYADRKIRSTDASSFHEAEFRLTKSKMTLRQYDPLLHFTSGGTAAYSGNLVLKGESWKTKFRLLPRVGERSFVPGGSVDEYLTPEVRNANARSGAYLYIGTIEPKQLDGMAYFADPAVPQWVLQDFVSTARAALSYFSAELGTPQRLHPVFFLMMDGMDNVARNYRGDTLSNQFVRINLFGGEWTVRDEAKRNQLRKLIAHEIFHIWNAEFYVAENSNAWMHEGAADFFALKSLVASSLITKQHAVDSMNDAINSCILGQMSTNLNSVSGHTSNQRLFYDCGNLIYYLSEQGAKGKTAFYREVFDFAKKKYSTKRFVSELAKRHKSGNLLQLIDDLERGAGVPLGRQVRALLNAYDIQYEASMFDISDQMYRQALLSSVISSDCKGVGYWTLDAGIKVDSNMGCSVLADFPILAKIMGSNLMTQPKAAYEAVRMKCDCPTATLLIETGSGKRFDIACGRPLPEVLPPVYITDLPW